MATNLSKIEIDSEKKYIDFAKINAETVEISCNDNNLSKIKFINLSFVKEIVFNIGNECDVQVNFIVDDSDIDLKFSAFLGENSKIVVNGVDFSNKSVKLVSNITLNGVGSQSFWNMSSLSLGNNIKRYNISFDHKGINTISKMNNYGVAAGESTLYFDGCSLIEKQSVKSSANQIAKIIIFDEKCRARANPVLKIDNDDIQASHGAAVGALNDDHMFYLLSRGISEKEARNLITYGYLKPVFSYFEEDEQKQLLQLLGDRI